MRTTLRCAAAVCAGEAHVHFVCTALPVAPTPEISRVAALLVSMHPHSSDHTPSPSYPSPHANSGLVLTQSQHGMEMHASVLSQPAGWHSPRCARAQADKQCGVSMEKHLPPNQGNVTWEIEENVPGATYFVRAYGLCGQTICAFGNSTGFFQARAPGRLRGLPPVCSSAGVYWWVILKLGAIPRILLHMREWPLSTASSS